MTQESISEALQGRFSDRLAAAMQQAVQPGRIRTDAAAWAVIAFWQASGMRPVLEPLVGQLAAEQRPDGRVPVDPRFPLAAWPTPLAVLAWLQHGGALDRLARATEYLLASQGLHWINKEPAIVGHDTSLVGWSWVGGAHSWIEPTSLVLLALAAAGKRDHARCEEGRSMILNRQLPGGGWNYGNTTVYGQELRPMIHSTGMALAALAGETESGKVAGSIQYLERAIQSVRSPVSLAWGIIGLTAWGRRPASAERWVAESIEKESDFTEYDLTLLCQLQCALLPAEQNPVLRAMKT